MSNSDLLVLIGGVFLIFSPIFVLLGIALYEKIHITKPIISRMSSQEAADKLKKFEQDLAERINK